jgi:hypothetical protein
MIVLTDREHAVLAHVVIDPDAWVEHAGATFTAERAREVLDAKVARWTADYDAAVLAAGGGYLTRAQREPQP